MHTSLVPLLAGPECHAARALVYGSAPAAAHVDAGALACGQGRQADLFKLFFRANQPLVKRGGLFSIFIHGQGNVRCTR